MINKVFIGLFVLLFLISCGLGGFSFYLNSQVNNLNSDMAAFKTDTTNKLTALQNDFSTLDSRLTTFQSATNSHLDTIDSSLATLNSDLAKLNAQIAESFMDVHQVYDNTIGGVCQIVGNVAEGSGFVYSADGYIVTCWHVVNGQSFLDVKLHDGRAARATVVGSDQDSDIAVIKINGFSNLQPLSLADSNAIVAGEPVIALGNPIRIFESVVYGIISRTKQLGFVAGVGWVSNLIQIDAAINPGNSGGPVINSQGQVIGISESSAGTPIQNINYAVSSNKIKRVAQAIIDRGVFVEATLPGTWTLDDLTPDVALGQGMDTSFGVIFIAVTNVNQVQKNDVIVTADAIVIKDEADLFSYIAEFKSVGDTITLKLIRGSSTTITVTLTLVAGWIQ